jgi:hypothetical protein
MAMLEPSTDDATPSSLCVGKGPAKAYLRPPRASAIRTESVQQLNAGAVIGLARERLLATVSVRPKVAVDGGPLSGASVSFASDADHSGALFKSAAPCKGAELPLRYGAGCALHHYKGFPHCQARTGLDVSSSDAPTRFRSATWRTRQSEQECGLQDYKRSLVQR